MQNAFFKTIINGSKERDMFPRKFQWGSSVWRLHFCIIQALRKHCETKTPVMQKLFLGEWECVEEMFSLSISS